MSKKFEGQNFPLRLVNARNMLKLEDKHVWYIIDFEKVAACIGTQ